MTTSRRWGILAAAVVCSVGITWAVRARPVGVVSVPPAALVADIRSAAAAPYSGFVETQGTLQLPVTDRFSDLGSLFGGPTRLRVWWRSAGEWRVDQLSATGETDLIRSQDTTTRWEYERARATTYFEPRIRLPRASDLVPPELGRRVLEDVDASELSALPARRVAGRPTAGVRVSPGSTAASIDHVDMWADVATGIPLMLEVHADPQGAAVFTTAFAEFSPGLPEQRLTTFAPPASADRSFDRVLDIADAANQFSDAAPPARLVGLPLSTTAGGAVGVYGTGVTRLLVIPLWDRVAVPLRKQLAASPSGLVVRGDTRLTVGPLGVLLTDEPGGGGWLVTGTVTEQTLVGAARELQQRAGPEETNRP